MITPGKLDLVAQRGGPFDHVIDFEGFDMSAATFDMEVRSGRDQPDGFTPLIALANAAPNAEGVSVSLSTVSGVPVSTVKIHINQTTLVPLLRGAAGPGRDIELVWDIFITGAGLSKRCWLEGKFIIRARSTQ